MSIELPEGYFISSVTGQILRKKGAVKDPATEALRLTLSTEQSANEQPVIEVAPVTVSIEELINYNTANFDFDSVPDNFITSLASIFSGNGLSSCCGVTERPTYSISAISGTGDEENIINFGRFFYAVTEHAWDGSRNTGAYVNNGIVTIQKRCKTPNKYNRLLNLANFAAYVFTWAKHQGSTYETFFKLLGATEIYVGFNPRYPYNSTERHEISIFVLDRVTSMHNFFEQHRELLTKEYLTNNQK